MPFISRRPTCSPVGGTFPKGVPFPASTGENVISLRSELEKAGHHVSHKDYFDTLKVSVGDLESFKQRAEEKQMNFRYVLMFFRKCNEKAANAS